MTDETQTARTHLTKLREWTAADPVLVAGEVVR